MLNTSLFKKANIEKENFEEKVLEALNGQQLFFALKWTKGGPLVLFQLFVKINDEDEKDALNGTAIKDTDGDISIFLGVFKKGDKLKITFGLNAFLAIPQIVSMIVQANPSLILERKPDAGFKNLSGGETWQDTFSITIQ
ncbi:hypothetical protein [Spirosoma validum]|uniref:Uncharacterized protein n=1 Tax=Spirosoma validum TaxID=2771355 RepID=A0A927B8T7_9BACT|nr:hypothetical protein [Spirosoma validum]MBD2757866.1 hypothetical protein [Spirosoma validum]